eukprot:CAMPEP_0183702436 /NCGR_PEP_ID=MMETSP0737-20130205/538_1 /TAXON_ID=385413 /ORGANISM="Thalassiosira miniscula, Strain CCMP1093" /LENGTH=218 /DNA_ID=CAMNT_0025929041 /DNA_START=60 /DNA_END=716 /DNA_ORIENTATION=-
MARTSFTLLLVISATSIPSFHATPPSLAQVASEVDARTDASADLWANDNHVLNTQTSRYLQLIPTTFIPDFGNDDNSTSCPTECALCQCNSTEDFDCLLPKLVDACASNSLEKCYASLLPADFDIAGLCTVQCDKPDEEIPASSREICRMCEIFACCDDCPSERAGECFPSSVEDGYTPVGWKPAYCSNGVGGLGMGMRFGSRILLTIATLAFLGVVA